MPEDRLEALRERTRYVPHDVEPRVFARWEQAGIFHPEPEGTAAENYSIAIPPPNVTGALHMGHALNGSIQDVLIRRARMRGRRTKWIFGTDHAGIATQVKVEQQLAEEGKTKADLGRDAFIERVWEWRREYGSTIVQQFKRLGCSCDYEDERFTMDDAYARAVAHVFVSLFEKGLIYRDNYMVNWDPGTRSAISDLEVEQRRVEDKLYSIDYPLESGSGSITIATVRPETMLADTAIAVNPSDERYTRLIGEAATLPIVGRRLPIIAEDYVDPEFGTGALKITPGHDPNDFDIGRRHGLEEVTVIGEDGRMTDAAGSDFAGLEVDEAREAVVARLKDEGRISDIEPYTHDVPHSHRSGRRIEPLISLQWFCDMNGLAQPAIEVVKSGQIRFHPENPYTGTYLSWLENIRPWVLSRQLWWGHRIPVYYCANEHMNASVDQLETCPECGEPVEQDPDVLDTWFSSGLWPFATLGWPEETPQLSAFYPTDALITARDIIFLWVARMVMLGIEFTGQVPFTDVPITSVIQAPDGRRMSKSLGTGIDPLDEIDNHGADAVRYGLLAMASRQDVRYSAQRVKEGEDLTNKLWNASRLVLMNVPNAEGVTPLQAGDISRVEDRWIVSAVERHTQRANELIDEYRFSAAALELYEAFWTDVCDWYLELVKPRLYEGDPEAAAVLVHVLGRCLTLLHPLMPHVTEEIWSFMPGERGLLAVEQWPEADESLFDEQAEAEMGGIRDTVVSIRRLRDLAGVKPALRLPAATDIDPVVAGHIANLARLELSQNGGEPLATVGAVRILANAEVDAAAFQARVDARREELRKEVERGQKKLANKGFVDKAPGEVVEEERQKLDAYRRELESLGG
ncbi:MAG TPA: valine--tRNA ligase [Thermoleophilaceae bacterium]|jgi:valyl-tRNA synthetase|nr:valine--tRNA ligase [Thermoleophilaceae bacterium]